jgi:peptide/nickel transport system ATP-binding protein
MAATPRYDRPDESLAPVRPEVIEALAREIAASDADWREARLARGEGRA